MEKCEHNRTVTYFCIYEYCSTKEAAGCDECMKKYHSHVGSGEYLKFEQTEKLIQKFNVENLVKPKCRQFQELIFSFFTQIKNQISQSIDIVAKSMVNKVGYPFLSNMNNLTVFKRLKNKEYKKLSAKEVKKFYEESKKLDSGTITRKDRQLYIQEIRQNFEVIQGFENLMKDYDKLVKKFYKNFKHDVISFKKIDDLRKYLNSVLKIDKINKKQLNQKISQNDQKANLSHLKTSPSSKKNLQPIQILGQKQTLKFSSASKPQQIERINRINNQSILSNGRTKDRNSQFFSIQKEFKSFQQDSFDQKEKQISQRKEKLMKMMNSKEKSIEKSIENSLGNQLNSMLNPPPQLNFDKITPQKSKKNEKNRVQSQVEKIRSLQNYFKVQIPKNIDLSIKRQTSPQSNIKRDDSVSSIKQEIFLYSKESKIISQNSENSNEKYKYALRQLPSRQSNSSEQESFVHSYINNDSDSKKNKMTESSPVKLNTNQNKSKALVRQSDQQKSAFLYLHALNLPTRQAINYLKASIKSCPKNISAAEYLSFVYLQDNKPKQCLDLCNQYVRILQKFEDTQIKINFINNKSAALNVLGRYSQSIMLLEEYLIHFEHAKMYKNLGDAYFMIGINEKCQYNYEKAAKLGSNFDQTMYNLAACLFIQGNFYGADMWIKRALEINKTNSQYLILRDEITKRMNQVAQEHLN